MEPRRADRAGESEWDLPAATAVVGHLDQPDPGFAFRTGEPEWLARAEETLESADLKLPHLPPTHLRLMNLISNPECDAGELARMVSTDVVLTASLLKTANSVFYGAAREIDSVRGAIARVGLRGLRSMLYMESLRSVMYRPRKFMDVADEMWRQACSSATLSRTLAVFGGRDPERSFVAGLLHDVGRVPVLKALDSTAQDDLEPRFEFAREALRRLHEPVGRRLAEHWNLPRELVEVCGGHHDPGEGEDAPEGRDLPALVHLADRIDRALAIGDEGAVRAIAGDRTAFLRAGIREDRASGALGACVRAFAMEKVGPLAA